MTGFSEFFNARLAGEFNKIANTEQSTANVWRCVAFTLFLIMGAVAVAAFYVTLTQKPDWETFLFRLGTAAILSVPAFYAANESSKHRNREKIVRKNFLEFSAIDAYLVNLPPNERDEIKGKLSEKFFGVPEIQEKTKGVAPKHIFSFVEHLVRDLTKGH